MPRPYVHDPEWLIGRMNREAVPSVGLDGFTNALGAVHAHALTDAQRRHVGIVTAGILIRQGAGTADTLRDVLEALGVIERGGAK